MLTRKPVESTTAMSWCTTTSNEAAGSSEGLRLLDAAGALLASGPVGVLYRAPWGGLVGNFSLYAVPASELCVAPAGGDAAWAGGVVMGGYFTDARCSYETRAAVAGQRGAAGVLFKGYMHSPFDWDGSSQVGLPPADFLRYDVYSCIARNVAVPSSNAMPTLMSPVDPCTEAEDA